MANPTKQLLQLLSSLSDSAQFCTSGSLPPLFPGLDVDGVGEVALPITAATAKQLIKQATQAPYGRGEETIVDTKVRNVWQLEPRQFTINNPEWQSWLTGLVDSIRKEFAVKGQVRCDLYKMLIYEKGSFFAPHRDSEKVDGMFATLVIGLPSKHKGGTLLVHHDGQTQTVDFAGDQAEYKIQYAAFYTDCQHEIKRVTSGYRVCLVYNLALDKRKTQPSAPRTGDKVDAVAELLSQWFTDETRNKIAIPLKHKYTEAGLSPDALKGQDQGRMDVLTEAGKRLDYQLYLSLMVFHQSGDVDYETVSYGRWGEVLEEEDTEMGEVYNEDLTLEHWMDAAGEKKNFGKMQLGEHEILSAKGLKEFPVETSVHEATGNEGATVQRWYRQGVIVLWPSDRYHRILAFEGPHTAVPALEELVTQTKAPAESEACRDFADHIITHWQPHGGYDAYYYDYGRDEDIRKGGPKSLRMLKLLEKLADENLAVRFLREVLPKDHTDADGPDLCRLCHKVGWEHCADALQHFVAVQSPENYNSHLGHIITIFKDLCCAPPKMKPARQKVCTQLAVEVEKLILAWDDKRKQDRFGMRQIDGAKLLASLTEGLSAIGESTILEQLLSHVLADDKHYDLHAVLIPATKSIQAWMTRNSAGHQVYQQLLQHCITELEQRTEKPIEEPADWAEEVNLTCKCEDCRDLQQFLRDPVETVHRFRVRKDRRQHLHQQIDSHRCDVDHVTDRQGSPQTLVCTKNRASYKRKTQQFAEDTQLLAELRGFTKRKAKGQSK